MTVLEFFKSLDKKEFLEFYLEYDQHTGHNDSDGRLEKYFDFICNYTCLTSNDKKCIIFGLPAIGNSYIDSFLIMESDLYRKSNLPKMRYSYELSPLGEILNYNVSYACIEYLGEFEYAAAILYELTYFGYGYEECTSNINDIKEDLNKAIDSIENGHTDNFITLESVFKDFKDDREPLEVDFAKKMLELEGKFLIKLEKELIKQERKYLNIEI